LDAGCGDAGDTAEPSGGTSELQFTTLFLLLPLLFEFEFKFSVELEAGAFTRGKGMGENFL
jgi:hypothetical protein